MRRPQTHHCAAVGQALAEMHQAGRDFPLRRANALVARRLAPAVRDVARRAPTRSSRGSRRSSTAELEFLEHGMAGGSAGGVIHADLFPDNVFFLKGKLSGLIDFYFACNDLFAYDLAVCLNAWCFEAGQFLQRHARAGDDPGLRERCGALEPQEREKLPILARGAALRFLLTRLYDWLTVPAGRARHAEGPEGVSAKAPLPPEGRKRRRLRDAAVTTSSKRVVVHTDGACSGNPGPGGWGVILEFNGHRKELSGGAPRDDKQPHGAYRGDRGAQGAEGPLRGRAPHRFRVSPERHNQVDPRLEAKRLEDRRPQAREERRSLAGARDGDRHAPDRLALGAGPCRA